MRCGWFMIDAGTVVVVNSILFASSERTRLYRKR